MKKIYENLVTDGEHEAVEDTILNSISKDTFQSISARTWVCFGIDFGIDLIISKIYTWGNSSCPHGHFTKHGCPICWKELDKEVEQKPEI
jgi:hypothetical protein